MTITEITAYLESLFPLAIQENWDNSGLIIGNASAQVHSALVCLNVTQDVVQEAIDEKCQLIISHHPLIFKGIQKLTGSNSQQRSIELCIKNDIAVYALHTNADKQLPGLNTQLAHKLGLQYINVLQPEHGKLKKLVTFCPDDAADSVRHAIFSAGAGVIGNYDSCSYNVEGFGTFKGNEDSNPVVGEKGELHFENEIRIETIFPSNLQKQVIKALLDAHPYEEVAYDIYPLDNEHPLCGIGVTGFLENPLAKDDFLNLIKNKLQIKQLRYSGYNQKPISKIAICCGSGASYIHQAYQSKADAFVTADISYHLFDHQLNNFLLVDAGHHETEIHFKEYLIQLLKKKFTNFAIHFAKSEKNHVIYF